MSRAEQALFLYDLLDGEAKNEIRFRPSADRVDPDKILTILTETYGCAKSLVSLQQQFFQRKQKEGESIREFSHALLSLMEAVKRRDSTSILNSDALVRDQFIEHVRDGLLRRELKRSVRLNPEVTFLNIRSEAIRWTEDGERAGAPRPRAYSCDSQAQVVSERHVDSQAVAAKANDDLSDIKECLRKQQAQLDRMWQHINSISHPPPMQARGPSGPPRRPYRFQPDGRPICLRCNEPGHIARFCHAELPAAGKLAPSGVESQSPGGEFKGSVVTSEQLSQLIGTCPVVKVDMGGVSVSCLLDTGSMVTTISESFFNQHFQPWGNGALQQCNWLQLRAANGLALPYLGYLELDILVLGKSLRRMGVLVIRDPPHPVSYNKKVKVPGLLGMNVINKCYDELFHQYGSRLFQSIPVQDGNEAWREALSECHKLDSMSDSGCLGAVRVGGRSSVRIPAGSWKMVTATCTKHLGRSLPSALFEPTSNQLPDGLLASKAFLSIEHGNVWVPIVNVETHDMWLPCKTVLGELFAAEVQANDQAVMLERVDESESVVQVRSLATQSNFLDLTKLTWPNLSPSQAHEGRALLQKYSSVFSQGEGDIGCTSLVQHEIPLTDAAPIRQRYRRLPPSQYDVVKAHIGDLLERGVVRVSCSPYSSPIVVVQKKDGTIRLCVDYRQLNARTRKDAFPLPRIEESLDALTGATLFSTLDMASGYNQVPVAEQDKAKTAFCTPFGLFEFNRMPFGLCNAPSTFQRLMERIFGDERFSSLLLYLDDIVVFSTSFESHLKRLDLVLQRLQQHNLKLKLAKCNFFQSKVNYLGHVISAEGVSTDPEKIRAVVEWKRPRTLTELRSFLGFASYYRRFVEGFAKCAAPLHKLVGVLQGLQKKARSNTVEGRWDAACETAFASLKSKMVSAPILGFADFSKPFILEIDASHAGLGAVLSQDHQGQKRPIAFASRGLHPPERNMQNYSSMKLELLALKWSVTEKFREYLLGAKFTVYTDNNPLSYLHTAKLGAVEQRWASQLALFDFELKYRPGTMNRNADALSRLPSPSPASAATIAPGTNVPASLQSAQASVAASHSAGCGTVNAFPIREKAELLTLQAMDPTIGPFLRYWKRGSPPAAAERYQESAEVRELVRQWKKIRDRGGVLYRVVQPPVGPGRSCNYFCPRPFATKFSLHFITIMGTKEVKGPPIWCESGAIGPTSGRMWNNGAKSVNGAWWPRLSSQR
ncbi:hypothetical protein ACEWY4_017163 [Coilia grayii]|uniref:Reverse transcriptase n=1 Tax=Coilia grayii TaxID=363190 RepID=A0ABD1JG09_9TELE